MINMSNSNQTKIKLDTKKSIILFLAPITFLLFFIGIFSFLIPHLENAVNEDEVEENVVITSLNESYNSDLTIIATDIKSVSTPNPDDDMILVGVRFEVTNNTNQSYSLIGSKISIYADNAAVDGTSVDYSYLEEHFNTESEKLHAVNLHHNKKTMGYEVVEINKNAETIEYIFDTPNQNTVTFRLAIPDVK